ncbi:FAD:protein FMN transferase [Neptuniibacter sp.]|uniref:FAD:protein FMN transferase n=1 Tax=Neptuniibacter sp. TaxID=1962643 RepID=UPI00261CC55C|nr:FAD:protein FMN transferase [Neptuniibacter sp.]MCP4596311.1 FAD:protein FMN transferase [Neptuniibacter sp.]
MILSLKRNQWPAIYLLAALFLISALFFLSGCQKAEERIYSHFGMTMGTTFSVKWVTQDDAHKAKISGLIDKALIRVNQSMSTYISDSELSQFNALPEGSSQTISDELAFVISQGLELSEKSGGAFDVTVGPLVNLWGFGPDGRVVKAPTQEQITAVNQRVGYTAVTLNGDQLTKSKDSYIDLSAIAKGYGVDTVAELLEAEGINSYLVEIGGELRAKGLKPAGLSWRIAIESPIAEAGREIHKIIAVSDIGVATSGDYRNYFEENGVRFSHTIDPQTAQPIKHKLASVTVLAKTCAQADGFATAMMVMGPEKALEFAEAEDVEAFLLVKGEQGFEELMTSGFNRYLVH